ncbi:MAG: DUF2703 domain-containing protein [Acidobacteriota bacterium]|nr:DUF2703 domain-containing protein [Acidobacteriota bacterium]
MKIEVLYVPDCPNHAVALQQLREILSSESVRAHVDEVPVRDSATAQRLKFPGSPTVRINGRDVEPQSQESESFGLMCRLYQDGRGGPSPQRLRAAIQKARKTEFE